MLARFTFPLSIIFTTIAIVFCDMQISVDEYTTGWQCHRVCSAYNQYQFTLPNQACSVLNGVPGGCEKKPLKLYVKGTWGRMKGIFQEHTILRCVSNGSVVGYLTSSKEEDEYIKWYDKKNDGNFYPDEIVKYTRRN